MGIFDRLKRVLKTGAKKVVETTETVGEKIAETTEEVIEKIEEGSEKVGEQVEGAWHSFAEGTEQLVKKGLEEGKELFEKLKTGGRLKEMADEEIRKHKAIVQVWKESAAALVKSGNYTHDLELLKTAVTKHRKLDSEAREAFQRIFNSSELLTARQATEENTEDKTFHLWSLAFAGDFAAGVGAGGIGGIIAPLRPATSDETLKLMFTVEGTAGYQGGGGAGVIFGIYTKQSANDLGGRGYSLDIEGGAGVGGGVQAYFTPLPDTSITFLEPIEFAGFGIVAGVATEIEISSGIGYTVIVDV